jgi:hypothetical protein
METLAVVLGVCAGFFAGVLAGIGVPIHAQRYPRGFWGRYLEDHDED